MRQRLPPRKAENSAAAETIFAPATASGRAAIAVLRLSGPRAGATLSKLAGGLPPPRHARHARLYDPESGEFLDDGMVLWLPGPHSATGEDMTELHVHGSRAVLAALFEILRREGLRLAEPGEFTRRAFQNGKLDLLEAEAVADLVAAETEAQRRQAVRQLQGAQGTLYRSWSGRLERLLAYLEAAIDFPEEKLPPDLEAGVRQQTQSLAAEITRHLADGHRGERLRDGIGVAILGPPNAGKSSLLNRIARREAAITSSLPGTTRDIVEVAVDLAGLPIVLADTAGLRETEDPVEAEGLRRALARAEEAELRLFVFEAGRPQDAAAAASWPGGETLLVANKSDLCPKPDDLPAGAFLVSALTGAGCEALLDELGRRVAETYRSEAPVVTRARHREALEAAQAALARAQAAGLPELRAEDLRLAWRSLGRITGAVDVEDLLDVIFRDFCLGK